MKKLHLDNKIEISRKIRNRKTAKVALIAIFILALAMTTGCGKNKNTEPATASTTVTKEETTPEVVEPTQSTPVETVEPTETVPETEDVESIDLSKYANIDECINTLQTYNLMIVVWNSNGGQTILQNGDHFNNFNNSMSSSLFFNRTPDDDTIKDVTLECKDSNADIIKTKKSYGLGTVIGEDVEYKVTFTYNDGTEETITVYITDDLAE